MNRRTFIKQMSMLGAGLLAPAGFMAGCRNIDVSRQADSSALGGGTSVAATPLSSASRAHKTIEQLRIGVPNLASSFDPHEVFSLVHQRTAFFMYDRLLDRDISNPSRTLLPNLAREWARADERTVDLTLRDDVLWHDGTPFSAADVIYTFERLMTRDPKLLVTTARLFWPDLEVQGLDEHHVRIRTVQPDPDLELRLSAPAGAFIIPAEHKEIGVEVFATATPIGTGPYKLAEWFKDEFMSFVAHDKYFGGPPAAQTLIVRNIPEVATRVAALLNNELDLILNVPPDQLAAFAGDESFVTKAGRFSTHQILRFNMQAPPADKREIRQALSLAIDREKIAKTLFGGFTDVPKGFQFEGPYYDPNRPKPLYDPEQARALLNQAGYANEPIIYVIVSPDNYFLERAYSEAIVGMWREIGVNAQLEPRELSLFDKALAKDNIRDHVFSGSGGTTVSPELAIGRLFPDTGSERVTGFFSNQSAAAFDELVAQWRMTTDQQQRSSLFQQMLDEIEREVPITPLWRVVSINVMRNNIDYAPNGDFDIIDLRPSNFGVK